MSQNTTPSNWWMYHGNPEHTGYVTGSDITSRNVTTGLKELAAVNLKGPVLSAPAIVDGFIYVGVANSHNSPGANGGSFYKIDITSGDIVATFSWDIPLNERDTHGFTGMGCTPAVSDGKIYFSAFNGKLYCLAQSDLKYQWAVDLRHADPAFNQPVNNDLGDPSAPPAAGWSSPLVVNGMVYVGMGEGENPDLYGFVYCLDGTSGKVSWIFCNNQFEANTNNQPNQLPEAVLKGSPPPPGYSVFSGAPLCKGCSVWSGIGYDEKCNSLLIATGNPVPDTILPSKYYSNGLLILDATSGSLKAFIQVPADSSYRPSDFDIDIGGSPTVFISNGRRVAGVGCKNGCYFTVDLETLTLASHQQLLPYDTHGNQIATVNPHPPANQQNELNPLVSNEVSNVNKGENYSGMFGVGALHPPSNTLFIGMGGPNYHNPGPGVDINSTPFMRAISCDTLQDVWPMDVVNNVERYSKATPPMYTSPAESGLSSPAVVNDVVFMATTKVSIYAFHVSDGTPLWHDDLGNQTGGYNGGYGYCMGPVVWGNYVVAGALIQDVPDGGGILMIYKLNQE